jgi:hypothetical protein
VLETRCHDTTFGLFLVQSAFLGHVVNIGPPDVTEQVCHTLQVHRSELDANGSVPWSYKMRGSYSVDASKNLRLLAPRWPSLLWPLHMGRLGSAAQGEFGPFLHPGPIHRCPIVEHRDDSRWKLGMLPLGQEPARLFKQVSAIMVLASSSGDSCGTADV